MLRHIYFATCVRMPSGRRLKAGAWSGLNAAVTRHTLGAILHPQARPLNSWPSFLEAPCKDWAEER
jgi:hypothetical protein